MDKIMRNNSYGYKQKKIEEIENCFFFGVEKIIVSLSRNV